MKVDTLGCTVYSFGNKELYYPVDISTTVFEIFYSRAVQYHTILHGAGVIAWCGCYCMGVTRVGPGAMRYPSNHDVL